MPIIIFTYSVDKYAACFVYGSVMVIVSLLVFNLISKTKPRHYLIHHVSAKKHLQKILVIAIKGVFIIFFVLFLTPSSCHYSDCCDLSCALFARADVAACLCGPYYALLDDCGEARYGFA